MINYPLNNLEEQVRNCTRCPLYRDMPGTKPVCGVGRVDVKLDIVFIGEALGEDEALLEQPFVGMCGKFLDKMLNKAELNRSELYITNTVKCRPTKNNGKANRPPSDDEIKACKTWLWKELQVIKPKAIVTLGKVPTGTILSKKTFSLGEMVGKGYNPGWMDTVVFPCYHPSYIMVRAKHKEDEAVSLFKHVKRFARS